MKKIDSIINNIIDNLLELELAEKLDVFSEKDKKKHYFLITPELTKKEFTCIIALGYPEKVGVWSNTLLKKNQINDSSMMAYFQAFRKENWGIIAINPHLFKPDSDGTQYLSQLQFALNLGNINSKLGFIGFSLGAYFTVEFLRLNTDILNRTRGIVLIDPFFKEKIDVDFLDSIKEKIILFGAEDQGESLGKIVSEQYNLPITMIKGIHGAIPNKALNKIIGFFKSIL